MRKDRLLVQDAWYEVRTAINNREPLFRRQQAVAIFCRVFEEAPGRVAFERRGFRLDEEWLSFYIKPADGLRLPAITQWVKQTFAVRFNLSTDRTGHVWGDRYWSRVVEGEPPEEVTEVDWEAVEVAAETGVISFGPQPPDGVSPLTADRVKTLSRKSLGGPGLLPKPACPPVIPGLREPYPARHSISFWQPGILITRFRLQAGKVRKNSPVTLRNPRVKQYPASIPRFIVPNGCSTMLFRCLMILLSAFILTCLTDRPSSLPGFEKSSSAHRPEPAPACRYQFLPVQSRLHA
jgi:hypothetical protein